MGKKKLVVNCAVCDARRVSETTLKSYEKIEINAACIFVSRETRELFSMYNVAMNATEVNEVPNDVDIVIKNGNFELSDANSISRPTFLVVNGSLNIKNGSQKSLDNIVSVIVNGQVSYPSNLQDQLPPIKVNGSTESYPHDAIRLKSKLIIDNAFIIKAKESASYYVKNKVVIPDEGLNVLKLTEKGVSFITKKAIIAEKLLEAALPLFNEDADTEVIPEGYSYITGGNLDDALIRKHGSKLYIDGDLTISSESKDALEKLNSVKVKGTVLIVENLIDKLNSIDAEYENMKTIKGTIISDRGILSIDKRMLDMSEHGITVSDCGVVRLKDDITPESIEKLLQFTDCGCIFCNEEQKSAVELVSEDVGQIIGNNKMSGLLSGITGGSGLYDNETQVINAANYTM